MTARGRRPAVTIEGNAPDRPAGSPADGAGDGASGDSADGQPAPPGGRSRRPRRHITRAQVARFVQAVRDSDQAAVNEMVLRLSQSRPWLAPLALAVGAFAMLFEGVKLLLTNWR